MIYTQRQKKKNGGNDVKVNDATEFLCVNWLSETMVVGAGNFSFVSLSIGL